MMMIQCISCEKPKKRPKSLYSRSRIYIYICDVCVGEREDARAVDVSKNILRRITSDTLESKGAERASESLAPENKLASELSL